MLLVRGGILHTMEDEKPVQADLLVQEGRIARIAAAIPASDNMR